MDSELDRQLDGWSFVHVSDMHIGSPRSYRFQPAWNENWETARNQIIELRPDLVLVGGDMTRDGTTHRDELVQAKRDFDALPFPTYCIPGNHEVGNKHSPDSPVSIRSSYVQRYRDVFGPSEWTFVTELSYVHRESMPLHGAGKRIRFSGCDAFLLGSGLPEEASLRRWLERQVDLPPSDEHVWVLHPALFADRFDEPDFDRHADRVAWYFALDSAERHYLMDILKASGATQVITGHIHCRRHVEVDGIQFHFAPSTAFPQWNDRWPDGDATLGFLQFQFHRGKLAPTFIPLRTTSDKIGYGPGGNPPLAGRDYAVAWEQPPIVPAAD